jgi:hypothetical protein
MVVVVMAMVVVMVVVVVVVVVVMAMVVVVDFVFAFFQILFRLKNICLIILLSSQFSRQLPSVITGEEWCRVQWETKWVQKKYFT